MKYDFQNKIEPRPAQRPEIGGLQTTQATLAAKAKEERKKYERDIEALAQQVNLFRIAAQRFFAGDLPVPPEELRDTIRNDLRRLQNSRLATSADNFRLGSQEAQFNSHVELFGRRLREREEGGTARRKPERPEIQHDPKKGVILSREGAVEALYKGLYMKQRGAKPSMDLERFRGHLEKQVAAIKAKTGASEVQFRIAEENGKMKIKAKPIKAKPISKKTGA